MRAALGLTAAFLLEPGDPDGAGRLAALRAAFTEEELELLGVELVRILAFSKLRIALGFDSPPAAPFTGTDDN